MVQKMTELHTLLEIMSSICLFGISYIFYKQKNIDSYKYILAIGMMFTGLGDLSHAVFSLLDGGLSVYWISLSWVMAKITLILTFVIAHFHQKYTHINKILSKYILSIPILITLSSVLLIQNNIYDFKYIHYFIEMFGEYGIYHPIDFILFVAYLPLAYYLKNFITQLIPQNTYYPLVVMVFVMHGMMALLSKESYDIWFMLAHAIKLAEFYSFFVLLLIKDYMVYYSPKNHISINISNHK